MSAESSEEVATEATGEDDDEVRQYLIYLQTVCLTQIVQVPQYCYIGC